LDPKLPEEVTLYAKVLKYYINLTIEDSEQRHVIPTPEVLAGAEEGGGTGVG
jgi:hypothetical protein